MKSKSRRTRKTRETERQRRIAEEKLKKQLQSGLRKQRMKVYGPSSSSSESSVQKNPAQGRKIPIVWPNEWLTKRRKPKKNLNAKEKSEYLNAQRALHTIEERREHAMKKQKVLEEGSKIRAAQKARVKYEQELEDWYVSKTRAAIERGYKARFRAQEYPELGSGSDLDLAFHEYMKTYSDSGLLEDLGSMPEPPA